MANVKVSPALVKVLEVIKLNKAVTPEKINAHMGNEYASKHICNLRKLGFEFETEKEGRRVTAYTLTKEPSNVAEIRNPAPKAPKEKAEKKEKAAKPVKAPKEKASAKKTEAKEKNLAKLKEVAKAKKAKVQVIDESEEEEILLDDNVDVTKAHSIDPDFDSLEGVDLASLVG